MCLMYFNFLLLSVRSDPLGPFRMRYCGLVSAYALKKESAEVSISAQGGKRHTFRREVMLDEVEVSDMSPFTWWFFLRNICRRLGFLCRCPLEDSRGRLCRPIEPQSAHSLAASSRKPR